MKVKRMTLRQITELWEDTRAELKLDRLFLRTFSERGKWYYVLEDRNSQIIHEPMRAYSFWALLTGLNRGILDHE